MQNLGGEKLTFWPETIEIHRWLLEELQESRDIIKHGGVIEMHRINFL